MTTGAMKHHLQLGRAFSLWMRVLVLTAIGLGCEREDASLAAPTPTAVATGRIEFAQGLHTDDPSVNAFVLTAMQTCIDGDYDAFRFLWSAHEEPLGKEEYERGFRAIKLVRIETLDRMKTKEGDIVYVVAARIDLDPAEVPEPTRDLVLLLVKEAEQWRLASAPRAVREAVKERAEQKPNTTGSEEPTT